MTQNQTSRRGFLKGSSLFAAALLLAASARAQDPAPQDPPKTDPKKPDPPKDDPPRRGPKTDEEIFAEQEKANEKELLDEEGREYRICPRCGNNMYRQGRAWTCSNCGYSYID